MEEQHNSKAWTPTPALQRPKQKKKKTWNTKGGRRTQKSLQRARVRLLVWAGTRFTKNWLYWKTCWTTWLDSKDFFFLFNEWVGYVFRFMVLVLNVFVLSATQRHVHICMYVCECFRATYVWCLCVRSNLFYGLCVCVCVFVKPVSLCVEILYGHLCLYLL